MTNSFYRISLDIREHGSHVSLKAKKGDTGRELYITLMDGRYPYDIADECRAVFTARKADGNTLYNACTIIGNTICYAFTPQTTSTVGRVECEIRLYGADNTLLTGARFTIIVEDTVYDDGEVGSQKEVTALTKLVSDATTLLYELEYKLAIGAFNGPQGISGVAVNTEGYFGLEVDSATGDLYFVTEDEKAVCPFVLDEDGNLFYEIQEG
jgi:hypothetical protein